MRNYSTSSGRKTASAQISSLPGALCGIDVQAPASGQVTILIYDSENSDLTNKIIVAEAYMDAGLAGTSHEYFSPIVVNKGIYAVMSGTSSSFIIRYLAG